ncbi:capsid protein [Anaerococcus sp. AGMB09787]|uniref:capsid protein n=1 Tax=Anaerococcus sp. AGMB09787 TaxID=2922869 RepID=UPI001FB0286E|nr:capsid protein [Anaerococcus sp. AGMB09787]
MATKIYTKNYAKMVADIFTTQQHFFNTFGGGLQTAADAEYNENFLELKVSPTNVVIQDYDTGENVAFGSGTGNSSRFGERQEIKSIDKTVKYDNPIAIHEGIDRFTVNDNYQQIIAERAGLHARKWVEYLNKYMADALNENAGKELTTSLTEEAISKLFFEARKEFVNKKVSTGIAWTAYVTADVYNILVESKLTTTSKITAANIGEHTVSKFKGFVLRELPDEYFSENVCAIFVPDNVGVVGLGLEVYRLIDSPDYNGVAIQGAGKLAKYIPDENKAVIIKATIAA